MFLDEKNKFIGIPLKAAGAEPFTLEHLAQWLEEKDGQYDYWNCSKCALAQYGMAHGMSINRYRDEDAFYVAVCEPLGGYGSPAIIKTVYKTPWTFKAAAARLREHLQAPVGSGS